MKEILEEIKGLKGFREELRGIRKEIKKNLEEQGR